MPASRLRCRIDQPIRHGLTWAEKWRGHDNGLIYCWERGREKREAQPDLAERAERGELCMLAWKGGVEQLLADGQVKIGTLQYLATWRGLRGEDLDIDPEGEHALVCSRTGQRVVFVLQQTPSAGR
jgi:hypothetical protein